MEDDRIHAEAKDYYSRSRWWSPIARPVGDHKGMSSDRDGVNGVYFAAGRDNLEYNSKEILTPDISETLEESRSLTGGGRNGEHGHYSRQMLSSEIVEIVEDGRSIASNKDRRVDDLYVAVGKDDLDVVKWALDHAVSPGARIFLVHVSTSVTMIPTPVGKFSKDQLTPQQVRLYVNKENIKRKELLQKYVQLSTEAKVTAETLLLESKDTGKAILDLISIVNITNLVIGIKKPPCSRHNNKFSKGEFVKKNAPASCEVTLVYNGEEFVTNPNMDGMKPYCPLKQCKDRSKWNFFQFICFSGCMRGFKDD